MWSLNWVFRVLGPYKNRARSVLAWTGLPDQSPLLQREVAARYGVTPRAIGQRIQRVAAAGLAAPAHTGHSDRPLPT